MRKLEAEGELVRIKEFVDPVLEIAEITDRVSKMKNGGKALLFENNGTAFPLLINAFGSDKRIRLALGVESLDDIGKEIERLFKSLTGPKSGLLDKFKVLPELGKLAAYMPKISGGRGACQEIIYKEPDLSILPVLKCWPADGGRFITFPLVISKDPVSGIRNVGMYRMQVFDKNLTGMHWHKHKVGARHFKEYKQLGKKMPIAVALGGDPILTYSATAPLPDNIDELMLAGFLRKEKVKLVKAITQDIEVPADADFIIEGYVDPEEDFIIEGPFGDHTGFYSLADDYPRFHVTCITHKKNAVYPTTIVGIPPQEDAWLGKATERIFLAPIRLSMLPELADMDLPVFGVAHNLTIVSIKKDYAGHAQKVMSALWGAGQMMFNKALVVVDDDVDVHDYHQVANAFLKNVNPLADFHFSMGPLDVLDHSSTRYAYGSKVCIDATRKYKEELQSDGITGTQVDCYPEMVDIKAINEQIENVHVAFTDGKAHLVFVAVNKTTNVSLRSIASDLFNSGKLKSAKMAVFFDPEVVLTDIPSSTWLLTNNIDAKRDFFFFGDSTSMGCVFIDATRKISEVDKFERDWPNIIVSSEETIEKVDKIWDKLNLGPLVSSPSRYYKPLVPVDGAVLKRK
ncbi:MAG: menaquinone biosynthesis decarboxylase [Bacteroidales bacterium]